MKNRTNFIPAKYRRPDGYDMRFGNHVAVYRHPQTGVEYLVELLPCSFGSSQANSIQILRRGKDVLQEVTPPLKTIKEAMETLERIFSRADNTVSR